MSIGLRKTLALALAFAVTIALTGCSLIFKPTKMAKGELYQSGDGHYDPYFSAVHQEQVAAAEWADEAKTSRKPIVTALDLRPGASNSSILSATRRKKGGGSLGAAIEQTTSAERERSRRLSTKASKLDELQKRGEDLKKQAAEDLKNLGADKADEKKVETKKELKRELSAAVDEVESMADDARKGAKEAEELASKLRSTWTGDPDDERPPVKIEDKKVDEGDKADDKEEKKPEPVAKKPAKKPRPKAPAKPKKAPEADKPAPAEKASKPAKPADNEVFNP